MADRGWQAARAAGCASWIAGLALGLMGVSGVLAASPIEASAAFAQAPQSASDSRPDAVSKAATPTVAGAAPTPCRIDGIAYEILCGSVRRPLDPARAQGVQIDVRYAVVPALSRRKLDDPVFLLAGGPGQSAVDVAGAVAPLLSRLRNRRDLVFVDQRGTGGSAPLECPDADSQTVAQQADPDAQAASLRACRDALQKLPYGDLRFFTTVLAVQDLDAVRAALGAEHVNLLGVSYGTRVGLDYLRQFPQRVRRVVLDGVAPPDMALPAAFSTDGQAAFDALMAACDAGGSTHDATAANSEGNADSADGAGTNSGKAASDAASACARRYPHLRSDWDSLLARMPQPVTLNSPLSGATERFTLTRDMLLGLVRGPLYVPALAAGLPYAITEAAQGRFQPLAGLASTLDNGRGGKPALGMHYSVVCAEDVPRLAGNTDVPGRDFGDSAARNYRQVCADWPRGAVPAAFYSVPASTRPVLLLSGASDPATPPRHALRTAKALGAQAVNVVVPNAGHGVFSVGCVPDLVFRFIDAVDDAQALSVDAACLKNMPRPPAFEPITDPAGGVTLPKAGVLPRAVAP